MELFSEKANQSLERTPLGLPLCMGLPYMVSLSSRRKETMALTGLLSLPAFLGEYSAAPIEGGGELPPLQKWQFIVGGIAFLCMSVGLLFKK